MRLLAEARTRALRPVGFIDFTDAQIVTRHNDVGSYVLKVPVAKLSPFTAASLVKGNGLSFWDDETGKSVLAGPITKIEHAWGAQDPYGGTLTVSGVSDLVHCADRIIYVDPDAVFGSQSHIFVKPTGAAESVALTLVRQNLGPGALAERRLAGLTLPTDQARGGNVGLLLLRFDNLLETLQNLSGRSGINLGFDIIADANLAPRFRVYEPQTRPVLLSQSAGTVRSGTSATDAPTTTRALVATKASSSYRPTREVGDADAEAAWGRRIEKLVSANLSDEETPDAVELLEAGRDALRDATEKNQYVVVAQEGDRARFLVDYDKGDRISYEAVDGVELNDVVREVAIHVSGDGTSVNPTVGPAQASTTPTVRSRVARLEKQIRQMWAAP